MNLDHVARILAGVAILNGCDPADAAAALRRAADGIADAAAEVDREEAAAATAH